MKQNLQTLSTLHYVYGGLTCFGGLAVLALVFFGAFLNSDFLAEHGDEAPPAALGVFFQALGWVLFAFIEVWGILTILSGRWIAERRNRTGSLVMAGFNCLNFPLGMALGIFTFVTLLHDDVEREYDTQQIAAA